MLNGQDWNEVVLHKPNPKQKSTTSFHDPTISTQFKIENETDVLHHDTVPLSLAKTIQQARIAKYSS